MIAKPLSGPAYGSIPHLPGSRLGPADRHIHEGQARICTVQRKHKNQHVIVQEKLDGSCCAVACLTDGSIVALQRSGYLAQTSPFEQHQLFAQWVREREGVFRNTLRPGERLVGEWLAQAHGVRYKLRVEPFAPFDLFIDGKRAGVDKTWSAVGWMNIDGLILAQPRVICANNPVAPEVAYSMLLNRWPSDDYWGHIDPPEGLVYRVERDGEVEFLAKWVRPDKVDGKYLPEISGGEAIWHWRPESKGAAA